jgi:hypothetical protein
MDYQTFYKTKQWDNFNMELYLNYLDAKYNGVVKSPSIEKPKADNFIVKFLKSFL